MRSIIKVIAGQSATIFLSIRGITLPSYFDVRDRITALKQENERDIINLTQRIIKPGMTVIDIGANVGLLTRHFAKLVGDKGRVLAFEPDPETFKYFKHNTRKFPAVATSQVALSDNCESAQFFLNARSGTSNSLVNSANSKETITVQCMTLDEFLAQEPELKIDLIKIDVEGAELKVLSGMSETFAKQPRMRIIMEFCPKNLLGGGIDPLMLLDFMKSHGFSLEVIQDDGTLHQANDLSTITGYLGENGYANLLCTPVG